MMNSKDQADIGLDVAAGQYSASWEEVCVVLDRIHALPTFGPPIDHGDLLYGDDGLPK